MRLQRAVEAGASGTRILGPAISEGVLTGYSHPFGVSKKHRCTIGRKHTDRHYVSQQPTLTRLAVTSHRTARVHDRCEPLGFVRSLDRRRCRLYWADCYLFADEVVVLQNLHHSPCFLKVLFVTKSLKKLCNDQISGDYSAPIQFFIQCIGMRGIDAVSACSISASSITICVLTLDPPMCITTQSVQHARSRVRAIRIRPGPSQPSARGRSILQLPDGRGSRNVESSRFDFDLNMSADWRAVTSSRSESVPDRTGARRRVWLAHAPGRDHPAWPRVLRFCTAVGGAMTLALMLLGLTPVGYLVLRHVLGVSQEIARDANLVVIAFAPVPLFWGRREAYWGAIMRSHRTQVIGIGKLVNVGTLVTCMTAGIALGGVLAAALPAVFGAAAFTMGELAETLFVSARSSIGARTESKLS